MKCVRCLRDTAHKIADAPDGSGAWEVFFCEDCHYSWRNDEPDFITVPEKRDPWSMLDKYTDFAKELPPASKYITVKKNPKTGI